MRKLSVLVPASLVLNGYYAHFGPSRIISSIANDDDQKALLDPIAEALTEVLRDRKVELIDIIKDKFGPVIKAESYEEFEAAVDAVEGTATDPLGQGVYDAIAGIVESFVQTHGSALSDEEKELEATAIFTAVIGQAVERIRRAIDKLVENLSSLVTMKRIALKMKENVSSYDTKESVADAGNVSEQSEAAISSEEGQPINASTGAELGIPSTSLNSAAAN